MSTSKIFLAGPLAALAALLLAVGPVSAHHDQYQRVSVGQIGGNGPNSATFAGASADGSKVFFTTQESLVSADTDVATDIYQRSGGTTTLVSAGAINGNGNFGASFVGVSDDGSRVFFQSTEPLTSADTDTSQDVYMRANGVTTLISAGGNGAFKASFNRASADGTRVFFTTAESLLPSDTDTVTDIYQWLSGTLTVVSVGPTGGNGAFSASFAGASRGGAIVWFTTVEPLVAADTDTAQDVYQRSNGQTFRVSTGQVNGNFQLSATFAGATPDGSHVYFMTSEALTSTDLDASQDVYQFANGTVSQVSRGQINGDGAFPAVFNGVSADGSKVWFSTTEQLIAGDTDTSTDIYQRFAGATSRVSTGAVNGNGAFSVQFRGASADGAIVVFVTNEALVSADTDSAQDIYQRASNTTRLVSVGDAGGNGAIAANFAALSADGTRVFFTTSESLVATDGDGKSDVYERVDGTTFALSIGNDPSVDAGFSGATPSGSAVFFLTVEKILLNDTDSVADVYAVREV